MLNYLKTYIFLFQPRNLLPKSKELFAILFIYFNDYFLVPTSPRNILEYIFLTMWEFLVPVKNNLQ